MFLSLGMWLDVNGQRRQTGSTSTMIFSPTFIVHYLSQFLVLEPGDLINTGTPPGVGMGMKPPVWLQVGDVVELGIDGLGTPAADRDRASVRAFVVTGPMQSSVQDVPPPDAAPGQLVVDVARVGVCGTDVEFFTGEMAYLHQGHARYPMRLGHEWCGTVSAVGRRGRSVLGRPAGHRRHHARLREMPPLPGRPAPRLRGPLRDRHPRRLSGRAGRAAGRPGDGGLRAARHHRRHRRGAGRAGRQRAAGGPGGGIVAGGSGADPRARARSACWPPSSRWPSARRCTCWA